MSRSWLAGPIDGARTCYGGEDGTADWLQKLPIDKARDALRAKAPDLEALVVVVR